jgi:hypothetical protein
MPSFDIESAIAAHTEWRETFVSAIEISDHTQCLLGAWLHAPHQHIRSENEVYKGINPKTFLFVARPAGEVRVAAYDLAIATHCDAGKKIHVRAIKKKDMSRETGDDLAPVAQEDGEKAIQTRKLAMPDGSAFSNDLHPPLPSRASTPFMPALFEALRIGHPGQLRPHVVSIKWSSRRPL